MTQGARQQLQILVQLQEIDRQRDARQSLIDTVANLIAAREKQVDEHKRRLQAAQDSLLEGRKAAGASELELKARAANIQKLELQLNTAKTNQEYQALQAHIKKVREEMAREEDAGLASYERIEAAEGAVARATAALKAAEADFAEYVKTCERDRVASHAEIAATDARRGELLEALTADNRDTYERVRKARDGVAVAPLDGRNCSGCGVGVTPNIYSKLHSGSVIVTCASCQRVIYAPDALKGA